MDCLVHLVPFGDGGKLTLKSAGGSLSSINKVSVFSTNGSNAAKSFSATVPNVLNAIPFIPNKTACLAAANVPECHIELPRLYPMFIPDNTISVFVYKC